MRGDTCCRMDELENSILPEIHYGQDLIKSYSSPDKSYLFKLYLLSKIKSFLAVLSVPIFSRLN